MMVVLHTVTGTAIEVNPLLITHLRHPEANNRSFVEGAQCMINMVDGKYVTVRETCAEVRQLIEEQRK
jgi:uncharacterized protein YlzI (FlbEa/FlbD family)